jgi:heterokaryon incompatibility protein (HET)
MSDRVIPVLGATIRALHPTAIWIDAFCIPVQEPTRTACLRSMGTLYSAATGVIAVLSKVCSTLLDEVARTGRIDETGLLLLEKDEWVSRAWTYQEIVNSKSFHFAAEGGSASLSGTEFLNHIGSAIESYKKGRGYDSFRFRTLHPRLNDLEDTIADWKTAGYSERSAYQVMSSMDGRTSQVPDDWFNALIGAITDQPLSSRYDTALHPAEYFMQVCEEKGDFSFIYSNAPRSNSSGRSWRPRPGPISAIQPWHTFGDGQSGSLEADRLRLQKMCRMMRGAVSATAVQFITKWLGNSSNDSPNLPIQILTRLRQAGFAGRGDIIELEEGYFFPFSRTEGVDNMLVFVALGVRWVHGGPGLIVAQDVTNLNQFRDVGVFVGLIPKSGESIVLG